jgi:small-conductance mechanosensitive channel
MPTQIFSSGLVGNAVSESYISVKDALLGYGLLIVLATIIFVITWVVADYVGKVVKKAFDRVNLDGALKQAGLSEVLNRGGVNLNTGSFFGGLLKWTIITVMFLAILQMLGLSEVSMIIGSMVVLYLPKIVVAILIMLVAFILGDVLKKVVTTGAANAHLSSAKLLGSLTKTAIIIFAVLSALVQLGIAVTLINTIFIGIVVALSLATGLAFGLGGKEMAARILSRASEELTHRK